MADTRLRAGIVELPELEYVNAHTLPCGCLFLIGWQEARIRHEEHGLVDLLEVHRYLNDVGERDDPAPEQRMRVVTRDEAEAIVDRKRDHEWWADHVVRAGTPQPEPGLCPKHAYLGLLYGEDAYATVCADQG